MAEARTLTGAHRVAPAEYAALTPRAEAPVPEGGSASGPRQVQPSPGPSPQRPSLGKPAPPGAAAPKPAPPRGAPPHPAAQDLLHAHERSVSESSAASSSIASIVIPRPAPPPSDSLAGAYRTNDQIDAMLFSDAAEEAWAPKEQDEIQAVMYYAIVDMSAQDMDVAVQIFRYVDVVGAGAVTRKAIDIALDTNAALRALIASSDDAMIRTLLNKRARKMAFRDLDKLHGKAPIEVDTWQTYVSELRKRRFKFLKMRALARETPRAYWGLGTYEDANGLVHRADCCGLVGCGVLPQGWLDDLAFFIGNHHPLLSIFLCDDDHPMGAIGKLVTELQVISLCLLGGAFIFIFDDLFADNASAEDGLDTAGGWEFWSSLQDEDRTTRDMSADTNIGVPGGFYTLSFFFVTVPSFFVGKLMRCIQTCPCCIYHHETCWKRCLRGCAKGLGRSVASVTLIVSLAASVFGVILGMSYRGPFFAVFVAFGRINGYFVWILLLLLKEFNLCCASSTLGLGRWKKERLSAATKVGGFYGDADRIAKGVLDDIEAGG